MRSNDDRVHRYHRLPKGEIDSPAFDAPARYHDGTTMPRPPEFSDGQVSIYEFGVTCFAALLDGRRAEDYHKLALEAAVAEKLIEED